MTNASITVKVGGSIREYELNDIDLDASRDAIAAKIGEAIIDGVWEEVEG